MVGSLTHIPAPSPVLAMLDGIHPDYGSGDYAHDRIVSIAKDFTDIASD